MRVNDLLANPEKFVGQVVELEGALYIESHRMKEWYLLDSMSLGNKPLSIKRSESETDGFVPDSDLTDFLDLRFGLYRKDNATFILNDITLTGKVTADENQLLIFSKNIEKLICPAPISNCTFYIKNNIQFHDVPLHDDTITPVLSLRDHLDFYMGKFIRVEGILRGDTRPEEMSWIASRDNGDANKRLLHETQFPLLLERKGILEEIVSPRVGGEFAYWDKVQVIGRVSESNQPPFVAMLTNMTHLLIKKDDNRCIVVHRFD